MTQSTISTSELKARCSNVIDEVARKRSAIIVTKHGRPVARIVPMDQGPGPLFGFARGSLTILGDILEPVDVSWEADE